jgi:hypothetical protein
MKKETKAHYQRKYYNENKEKIAMRKKKEYLKRKERNKIKKMKKQEAEAANLLKLRELAEQGQFVTGHYSCNCQGSLSTFNLVPTDRHGICSLCGYQAVYSREPRQIDTSFSFLGRLNEIYLLRTNKVGDISNAIGALL